MASSCEWPPAAASSASAATPASLSLRTYWKRRSKLALAAVTRVCRVLPILQLYSMQHLILDSMSCFVACQLHQRGEGFLAKLGGLRRTATAPEWTDAGFQNRDSLFAKEGGTIGLFPYTLWPTTTTTSPLPRAIRREGGICSVAGRGRCERCCPGSARFCQNSNVCVCPPFCLVRSLVIYDEQISSFPQLEMGIARFVLATG